MPPPGMDIFPTAIRLRVLEHGYAPVPIVAHDADHKSCGKAVNLSQWTTIEITPEAVRSWRTGRQSGDIGTGLRCGELVGVGKQLGECEPGRGFGPPAWAQRMKRNQTVSQGISAADHAIRSGDRPIGSSGVDLSEGE